MLYRRLSDSTPETTICSTVALVFAFGLTLLTIGCSEPGPKLLSVKGTVTHAGKPLRAIEGYVIFHPHKAKGNKSQEEPRAIIDDEGKYELSTHIKKGAAPGWYKVVVHAAERTNPKDPYFTKWLIPQRYTEVQTTDLAIEVIENPGPGAYDIKLDPK